MGCGGSAATKVFVPFVWGNSGSVIIKSLKFILVYDPDTQGLVVRVSNERLIESLLQWNNRRFTLEDLYITDTKSMKKFKCPGIKASFSISDYDQFQGLNDTNILLNKIQEISGKTLERFKSDLLISAIKNECKDLWDFSKDFWVRNKNNSQRIDLVHFGRDCFSTSIESKSNPLKLQAFLEKKYKTANFKKLKKDTKAKVIMEKGNNRPHIIKLRKSINLNFFVESQHLVEIQEEIKIYVFCWEDIPELSENEIIGREIRKLQSGINRVKSEMQQELDSLMAS
jgi:hypothetical protein